MDAYVEAQMKAIRLPGLALAIVHGDQIAYQKGYGFADPSGRPVTAQTPFLLASLAKPVTALAVMQLVEGGRLELDAPVQRYLPWFRLADEKSAAAITVRHLLNQTSGLSAASGNEQFPSRAELDWTPEQRVRELHDNTLAHPVGVTFEYSNVNYVILALIVESVAGQPFETYVAAHIFGPLEMDRSAYYRPESLPPATATGYRQWFGIPVAASVPLPRSGNGPGGLIASAEDMAHFLIPQLNQGRYRNAVLLSPAGMAEMHRPAAREGDGDAFYAMGWETETADGRTTLSHNGDHANYHGTLQIADDGWGIVMMTNAAGLWIAGRPAGIAAGVASLVQGRQPPANEGIGALRAIYLAIMGIVALQIVGLAWSLAELRRWHQFRLTQPGRLPQGWLSLGWHVAVPVMVNLVLAYGLMVAFPAIAPGGLSLPAFVLVYPDVGYAMVTSGVLACAWMVWAALAVGALNVRPAQFERADDRR